MAIGNDTVGPVSEVSFSFGTVILESLSQNLSLEKVIFNS